VSRAPHVNSEFEKKSGTSVASDPARDDPYNGHLVTTASEVILYIKLSVSLTMHSNINYIRLEGPKRVLRRL